MNDDPRAWVQGERTHRVVGCAMHVLNALGHGLREKTYERALCVELRLRGMLCQQQRVYPVHYRGVHIDDYVPDLQVDDRLIVEVKTTERICTDHIGQVLNYLRITRLEAGLILNFKHPRLTWKKIALQDRGNRTRE